MIDYIVIGEYTAAVFSQKGDELIFDLRQMNFLPLQSYQAFRKVDGQVFIGINRL